MDSSTLVEVLEKRVGISYSYKSTCISNQEAAGILWTGTWHYNLIRLEQSSSLWPESIMCMSASTAVLSNLCGCSVTEGTFPWGKDEIREQTLKNSEPTLR